MWPFDLFISTTHWVPGTLPLAKGASKNVYVEAQDLPIRVDPKKSDARRIFNKGFATELLTRLERGVFSGDASVLQAKFDAQNPLEVSVTISNANVKLWVGSKKHIRLRKDFVADLEEAVLNLFKDAGITR